MLRKAPISSVTSVCLSAYIIAAASGRISVKFDIGDFYENLPIEFKFNRYRAFYRKTKVGFIVAGDI
jgi:hypothetical protein